MERQRGREVLAGQEDAVAVEEPLEIRVAGHCVVVTMRTPGHDEELAVGFLLSEGIVQRRADVVEVSRCTTGEAAQLGNVMSVFLAPGVEVPWERLSRHVYVSSSCGLCGKSSIEAVHLAFAPLERVNLRVKAEVLWGLPEKMREDQAIFQRTGGLHAAALFDADGRMLVLREDVGRHNAVDKVIGRTWLDEMDLRSSILMVSGRVSFEILQKALSARVPLVAAVSAPTNLAVEFARANGQGLIGFVRGNEFNVYAGGEMIG